MKFHWGIRIAIVYIGFVALIVTLVIMSMNQRLDLVTSDYYKEELKYQEIIDKKTASNALKEQLQWQVLPGSFQLNFPDEFAGQEIHADVHFFRPSDSRLDKKIEINSNELQQSINTSEMPSGYYEVKIDWSVGNKKYYNEGSIQMQN